MTRNVATALVCALGLAAIVGMFVPWPVRAHEPYSQWRKPDNPAVSCCDNTDCRPTRAYPGDDGLWRVWIGGRWLTVPHEVVLPTDYAKDGRSHVCEKDGYFYCFTPGEVRG